MIVEIGAVTCLEGGMFISPEDLIQNKEGFKCAKFLQAYCKDKKLKFDMALGRSLFLHINRELGNNQVDLAWILA